ncbi:hypothetical protein ZWY2020_015460 [Hordeum vulgare]|nr:hypothetical protein ZWY2020_015460 [Hordeum vulgare]
MMVTPPPAKRPTFCSTRDRPFPSAWTRPTPFAPTRCLPLGPTTSSSPGTPATATACSCLRRHGRLSKTPPGSRRRRACLPAGLRDAPSGLASARSISRWRRGGATSTAPSHGAMAAGEPLVVAPLVAAATPRASARRGDLGSLAARRCTTSPAPSPPPSSSSSLSSSSAPVSPSGVAAMATAPPAPATGATAAARRRLLKVGARAGT